MNRRDFLDLRSIGRALGPAGSGLLSLPIEAEPAGPDAALLRFTRQAMATTFEVVLPFGIPAAWDLAGDVLDEIDRLERQLSVYRDDSEVSQINHQAAQEPVIVEPRLFALLQLASRLAGETEGAFDPTTGALIKAWGFFRGPRQVPSKAERLAAHQVCGMHHVQLDPSNRTVRFLRPGLEFNFGSIGKGYALDRAAEVLRSRTGPTNALLQGGGSSVCALGSLPGNPRGWPVGITHPWQAGRRLAVVHLKDQALGTSAATFQHLEWLGRKLGHILDPRTGWPAEQMALASVVAPTAAEADALATAFFVLGMEKARSYCETHPAIAALMLSAESNAQPVTLGPTGLFAVCREA